MKPIRWSKKLTALWQRAIEVSHEQIAQYSPTALDIEIAEALLNGAINTAEISAAIGRRPDTIVDALRDPVAAAWISKQVSAQISNRLGLVDAAVLRRAIGGDVQAAKLLYERAGRLLGLVHHVHHRGVDYSKFTDDQLNAVLLERLRAARPVDVTVTTLEGADYRVISAPGGASAAATGSADPVLPAGEPEARSPARPPGAQEGDGGGK